MRRLIELAFKQSNASEWVENVQQTTSAGGLDCVMTAGVQKLLVAASCPRADYSLKTSSVWNNEGGRATIWAAEAFSGPPFGRFNDGRATWIGNLNTKWLSIRHTHTPTSRRISKSDVWNYLFIHSAFIVCCSLRQTNCGSFSNIGCLAAGSLNVTATFSDICI